MDHKGLRHANWSYRVALAFGAFLMPQWRKYGQRNEVPDALCCCADLVGLMDVSFHRPMEDDAAAQGRFKEELANERPRALFKHMEVHTDQRVMILLTHRSNQAHEGNALGGLGTSNGVATVAHREDIGGSPPIEAQVDSASSGDRACVSASRGRRERCHEGDGLG